MTWKVEISVTRLETEFNQTQFKKIIFTKEFFQDWALITAYGLQWGEGGHHYKQLGLKEHISVLFNQQNTHPHSSYVPCCWYKTLPTVKGNYSFWHCNRKTKLQNSCKKTDSDYRDIDQKVNGLGVKDIKKWAPNLPDVTAVLILMSTLK